MPRENHYRPVIDLLELVATGGHLGDADGFPDASTVVRFESPLGGGTRTINLSYDKDYQHFYHPDLDIALLQVHGLDGDEDRGHRGISSLLSVAKRPAFFHILRSFDVVFGQDSSLETVVDWRQYEKPEQRNLSISHHSHLLIVGTPLVPNIGLERLRETRTFSKWELPGPIFVYLSPAHMYTYEYEDGIITVVPLHNFTADELWDGPTDIRTPDEDGDALVLSTSRLEQGLSLPRTIAFSWDTKLGEEGQ